ncbi:hypothetical protein [Rhodococcus sp. IEGM 1379]|uniref:hypothetical protein n=1 Tax=Rhodococcus sp. IEGM 1379 TaxID=3047086 RepID=UPI0024B6402B|nr:hypothetical protein [Rhodococcus sp. IEGM 1379]MDI9913769.1 hypothetical protein [Rhodococcus sp. IEGM 1379]
MLLGVTDSAKELGGSFFGPLIGHAVDVLETFTAQQLKTIGEFLTKMSMAVETTRADQAGAHEPSGD